MEGGTLAALGRLEGITPSRLWTHLDPEVRTLAARSFYAHDWGDVGTRREADLAIAQTLRFREASVRKLTVEKRVEYLARAVRPSDTLAHSLLLALHLEQRRPLLAAFLDELGVPHHDGLIAEDHDMTAPDPQPLRRAASQLLQRFPPMRSKSTSRPCSPWMPRCGPRSPRSSPSGGRPRTARSQGGLDAFGIGR